jgi:hypothetical protein
MANPEHLEILKEGVSVWNEWRRRSPLVVPNLREADLYSADLGICAGSFRGADLQGADLDGADLERARLSAANLKRRSLHHAILRKATLTGADLTEAGLQRADLQAARLRGTYLYRANLVGVNLYAAIFCDTYLREADLTLATVGHTQFDNSDLSEVRGLETIHHSGPSTIGIDTIYKSKANIPEVFLRGCGVPEDFILYMKSLVGKPIEFYSCFISYSSKDDDFAQRLYADLQAKNVRCWFAPEDLKIGDRFRMRIDEAVRFHDKLLLVLSADSVKSAWVEKEVETAFEKERRQDNKPVLFPIRLDDAVMETDQAWAADIRRTRHIGDFTRWKDHDAYQQAFQRLQRDLKAEATSPK